MRTVRISACLAAVLAVGLVTASSALATPEYDAASFPAETKGEGINDQGFNGGGVVIVCPALTTNTNEEIGNDPEAEAVNTTKNQPTLTTHPIYGGSTTATKCHGTLVAGTFEVNVKTKFCNFRTHAVPPGGKTGTVDVVCEKLALTNSEVEEKSALVNVSSTAKLQANFTVTGTKIPAGTTIAKVNSATQIELSKLVEGVGTAKVKETLTFKSPGIENEFLGLSGCTITVFPQTLTGLGYKNEPKGGTAEQEVTVESEVAEIKSKATGPCGIGEAEFKAEYREGKIKNPGMVGETAEIEPPGKPAKSVTKGVVPGTTTPIAGEVGINEPHWYEQHVVIGSTEPAAFIAWGKQHLEQTNGEIQGECNTLWGGTVANPQGGGAPPGGGMAVAGEVKIAQFRAFNCHEAPVCETTDKSKLSVEPEGLGIVVSPPGSGKAEQLQWGATVSGASGAKSTVTLGAGPEVKLHVVCPEAESSGKKYEKSWTGALQETLENGTAKGSAPSALKFASGELKVNGVAEGKVTGTLKMMGFDSLGILSTSNP